MEIDRVCCAGKYNIKAGWEFTARRNFPLSFFLASQSGDLGDVDK